MRLDSYLVENNYYNSRNKASEGISRGEVFVNGKACLKASYEIKDSDVVNLNQQIQPFVSLGGYKLETAILNVAPPIQDGVFIDVGASTGGFTDCLLRYGAKRVYCVDVGENLLDKRLASCDKVVVMDKTNARYLTTNDFSEKADGIVVDCSFIALEYVLPPLPQLLKDDGYIMALIKPQFELFERKKLKNGVLKSEKEIVKILNRLYDFCVGMKLNPIKIIPVTNSKRKNSEYVIYLKLTGNPLPFEKVLKG